MVQEGNTTAWYWPFPPPLEAKYLAKHEDASSVTKLKVESVSALLEQNDYER